MKTKIYFLCTWVAVIATLILFEHFLSEQLGIWATSLAHVIALIVAITMFAMAKIKNKTKFTLELVPRRETIGSSIVLSGGLLIAMFVRLLMQNLVALIGLDFVLISHHTGDQITFVVLAILLPTIFAEILHRGIFLPRIIQLFTKSNESINEQKTHILLISAALFAVTALDLAGMFGLFILGLFITWVVLRTNSMLVPLIFHIIYNALVRGEALLLAAEEPWLIGNFGAAMDIWQIVGFAFIALGVATPSIYFGARLLDEQEKRSSNSEIFSLVLVTLILMLIGVSVTFFAR